MTTAAELQKLRTLPAVALTIVATAAFTVVFTAALGGPSEDMPVLQIIPFMQVGVILLGILPSAHEYAGSQFRTTLAAEPHRGRLLLGKTLAASIVVVVAVILTVGSGVLMAMVSGGAGSSSSGDDASRLLGAAVYLVLIGVFSHLVTVSVRYMIPALVGLLGVVVVFPPMIAAVTEHARWLPGEAGGLLYRSQPDAVLGPVTGALVLLGWILVAGVIAAVVMHRRDG
ncbi:Putative membrane protein [Corynebacterium glyciniphilum AJ 3170]|uniref:Putative membrane protein n=1 Tax=Corynebacterium glyciniphilum AJ 3170 TaxID=1404245 RepID=X5EFA5_9CORY|nr:ABC transporter permease [Corynebacterium glyciniphilum]AHW65276.1 Putative membrane protein [Corynebacterium glyciniphilum AJ 3170]